MSRFNRFFYRICLKIPYFHFVKNTKGAQAPCTFSMWFMQKIVGFNRKVYWPVHFTSKINQYQNICIGVDTNPGIEPGCYIQGIGKVFIGDYTQIAQNVGIISSNHDFYDLQKQVKKNVEIGKYCWIGMNAIILPGVKLGDFTMVGAGSVVTKSYPEGYCVIAGNPAKKIKVLDVDKCIQNKNDKEYVGYISKDKFKEYREQNLWL